MIPIPLHPSPRAIRILDRAVRLLAGLLLLDFLLVHGYQLAIPFGVPTTRLVTAGLLAGAVALAAGRIVAARGSRRVVPKVLPDPLLVGAALLLGTGWMAAGFLVAARHLFLTSVEWLTHGRGRTFVLGARHRPAILVAVVFLGIILAGAVLLSFPGAAAPGQRITFLDAAFTATSAVCVTGLVVVDTATAWSEFGLWVILGLIQVGGLGIMTLSATAILALGRGLGPGSQGFLAGIEETVERDVTGSLRFIVVFTFATEVAGAVLLTAFFSADHAFPAAVRHGVFHAISAFCNAGFSTFSTSLESYSAHPGINLVVIALVTAGGIGFPVAMALRHALPAWRSPRRLWRSLDAGSRLVLKGSAGLVAMGTVLFLITEGGRTRGGGGGAGEDLLIALFQSVSLRTAGFNTVPTVSFTALTATWMLLWMFVGGSPGGTAGGVKTTTFGILALTLRSLLGKRVEVETGGRSVGKETVLRAVAVTFLGGVAVFLGLCLLLLTERHVDYIDLVFEAVSAFGTVGLSLGATAALTPWGRLTIMLLMFVGRTGPLTLAYAIGQRRGSAAYRYPEARILVG